MDLLRKKQIIYDSALIAITLMIAESRPEESQLIFYFITFHFPYFLDPLRAKNPFS